MKNENFKSLLKEFEEELPKALKPKKTKLNKLLEKIDYFSYKFFKKFILHFVKKSKYKKNKYKIFLMLHQINISLLVVTVFIIMPIVFFFNGEGSLAYKIVHTTLILLVYSPVLILDLKKYKKYFFKEKKYLPLFLLRKNHNVYNIVKFNTKMEYIAFKKFRFSMLKMELLMFILIIPFLFLMAFSNGVGLADAYLIWFLYWFFIFSLENYIDIIFDFDKPSGKKKKAKQEMTEIAKKAFENLSRLTKPSLT